MTKEQAIYDFKNYVALNLYIKRVDYWTAQEAWAAYVDGLCKDGQITERQYMNWTTPFKYGKSLRPSRKQLERVVYA